MPERIHGVGASREALGVVDILNNTRTVLRLHASMATQLADSSGAVCTWRRVNANGYFSSCFGHTCIGPLFRSVLPLS